MCEFSITLCVLVFLSKTRLGGFLFNWRFSFTLDWPTQLNVLSAAWARILSFRNMACKFISKCTYILMYVCGHLFLYWTENLILCVQWFLLVLNYALVSLLWRRICLFLFLFLQKLKFCNQTKKKHLKQCAGGIHAAPTALNAAQTTKTKLKLLSHAPQLRELCSPANMRHMSGSTHL